MTRAQAIALIVGTLTALAVTSWFALRPSGADAIEVLLEPVGSIGPLPFDAAADAVVTPVPDEIRFRAAPGDLVVAGTTPGLYGGSGDEVCDREALVAFFARDEAKAAAWASVLDLEVDAIPSYLDGLTPAVLLVDTWVTNHGYDPSTERAVPRQSILQAGTAVLIDDEGVPRVRCRCGNPLTPAPERTDRDRVELVGERWQGFDLDEVITIVEGEAVTEFTMRDLVTGGRLARLVGTTIDFPLDEDGLRLQDIEFDEPEEVPSEADAPLDLAASATSGLGVAYAATGSCRIVDERLEVTGSGTCTVTISQPGDDVWAAAEDVEFEFATGPMEQLVQWDPPDELRADDPPLALDALATSDLPVAYEAAGACAIEEGSLVVTGEGTCRLVISQAGDDRWAPVEREFELEVGPPAGRVEQTIDWARPGNLPNGTSASLAARATSGLTVAYAATGACRVQGSTLVAVRGGSCTVTASQPGDPEWLRAPSVTHRITVTPGDGGTISFDLPSNVQPGATFTLPAVTSRGLPVTYAVAGPCSLDGLTLTIGQPAGTTPCEVTGSHPGNADWRGVSERTTAQVTTDAAPRQEQVITFASIPALQVGETVTLSATASSGLDVVFSASGGCRVDGQRLAGTSRQDCTVTARQPGDDRWSAADDVVLVAPVAGRAQAVTVDVPALVAQEPVTVSAAASSGLPVALTASGDCRIDGTTLTPTSGGTCTITGVQAGDGVWARAEASVSPTVARRQQTISVEPTPELAEGQRVTIRATATGGGPIAMSVAGGSCDVDGDVVWVFSEPSCVVALTQAGDEVWAPAETTHPVVVFKLIEIELAVERGRGTLTVAGESCSVSCVVRAPATYTFTAVPDPNWFVESWGGICAGTSSLITTCTREITTNARVTVRFEEEFE